MAKKILHLLLKLIVLRHSKLNRDLALCAKRPYHQHEALGLLKNIQLPAQLSVQCQKVYHVITAKRQGNADYRLTQVTIETMFTNAVQALGE